MNGKSPYKDWRWRAPVTGLREQHLAHNPLCVECQKEGRAVEATVVDHIKPHRGSWDVFLDPDNLQALCKQHHDAKTRKGL